MNKWHYVRLAVLLFVAVSSFFVPLGPQAAPPISWGALGVILVFSVFALPLVLSLQVINPRSAPTWRHPSWGINPFAFSEPLQFFHLAAYVCLIQGLVTLVRVALSDVGFYVEALVPLAMAGGIFVGLRITMLLFRSKMKHGS